MRKRNIGILIVIILICIMGIVMLQLNLKSSDKKNGDKNSMIIGDKEVMYIDLTDDSVDYKNALQNHTTDNKNNEVVDNSKNESKLEENYNENKQEDRNEKNNNNNRKNEKYYNVQIDLKNNIVVADNETKSIQEFFELDDVQVEKITSSEENLKNYLKENMMGDIDFSENVINIENAFSTLAIIIKTDKFGEIRSLGNVNYVTKVADTVYVIHYKNAEDTKAGYDLLNEDPNVEMVVKDYKLKSQENTENIEEVTENSINDVQEASANQERATSKHQKYAWGVKTTGMYKYAQYTDKMTSRKTVRVAVLDTGVRTTHEIFKDRLDMKYAGAYGKDWGYGTTSDVSDEEGHGTMVAGIIAEATPKNVKIVPVKCDRFVSSELEALRALANNVDIINRSFGGYYSEEIKKIENEVLKEVKDKNTIIVCSSGNDGNKTGYDYENHYPSASPYTISVGATDINRKIAGFSNYASSVDFTAPGVDLVLPCFQGDDTYATASGTSLSSPLISAAFALLKTENPNYSVDQLKTELIKHCDDLGTAGKDKYYGYGEVNFFKNKFSTPAIVEADSEQKWGKDEIFTVSIEGINNITHYYCSSDSTVPSNEKWGEIPFKNSGVHKIFNMNFTAQRNGTKYIWLKDENGNVSERFEYEVKYIDDINPVIVENLSDFNITPNAFNVKFKAYDKQTGIKKIKWYFKQENEENYATTETVFDEPTLETIERTLQRTGIRSNSKTQIYAEIYDAADNCQKTNEITVITPKSSVSSISVQTNPIKTTYIKGEKLDLTGGKIKVTYEDKTTEIIDMKDADVSVTGYNQQTLGEQVLTVQYQGKTTTFKIKVKNDLVKIEIVDKPNKTIYFIGESFEKEGMKVVATYEDNTKKEITTYNIVGGENLTLETANVIIKYTENEITKTVEQKITVLDRLKEQLVIEGQGVAKTEEIQVLKVSLYSQQVICHLSGIIQKNEYIKDMKLVEQNGWKIQYDSVTGEFDLEKSEGAKIEEILNIEITTSDKEGKGKISLTNIKMMTKDAETIKIDDVQNSIEIQKPVVLTEIKVSKKPDKLVYTVGEKFDKQGMEILAEYSNSTSKIITNYTYSPSGNLKIDDNKIVISYAEEGISREVELEIEVNNIPENNDKNNDNYDNSNSSITGTKNDSDNTSTIGGAKDDSTVANTELPKAGYEKKIICIVVIVISMGAIYFYSFIKKYKSV